MTEALPPHWPLVLRAACELSGCGPGDLRSRSRSRVQVARRAAFVTAMRQLGYSLVESAQPLQIHYSSASRLEARARRDAAIMHSVARICDRARQLQEDMRRPL